MTEAVRTRPNQAGFTLIEVMVVVLIIAVMAGIGVLAVRQAEGRTLKGQAEQLQVWLQSLADRSILEQNAYGFRLQEGRLQPFIYYRHYWYPVRDPAPFLLHESVQLALSGQAPELVDEERHDFLPRLVFSQGSMMPEQGMVLSDNGGSRQYQFHWDDEHGEVLLQAEGDVL